MPKLSWQPPVPVRIDLFRYDNRADPEDVNADLEWGWRTRFNQSARSPSSAAGAELKAQAMSGHTRMGFPKGERRWVDDRFRSAFVLLTKPFGRSAWLRGRSVRDAQQGQHVGTTKMTSTGWSAMLAGKREWRPGSPASSSCSMSRASASDREDAGLEPRQRQTQLQAAMRMHW